jgi:hypothetical protein
MTALHKVRAVALTDYAEVARSVGVVPEDMLRDAGIDPDALRDPEFRLPATSVAALLESSARLSGCDAFGILMAERRSYESLGTISDVLKDIETVRQVIESTISRRRQLNDVFELAMTDHADGSVIEVSVLPQFAGDQPVNQTVAMTYVLLRGATNGGWRANAVHFRHRKPRHTAIFERFFGVRIYFESDFNGFECSRAALDRRCGGDPRMAAAELIESLELELGDCALLAPGDGVVQEMLETLAQIRQQADWMVEQE